MINLKTMNVREKWAIAAAVVVVLFLGYTNMTKRFAKDRIQYQGKIQKSEAQILSLKSDIPDLGPIRERVKRLNESNKKLVQKIADLEKELPSKGDVSQLLREFSKLGEDLQLQALRQKIVEDKEQAKIYLEMQLRSSYPKTVDLIRKIETISPFLKIEELGMQEPKGKAIQEEGIPIRLVVSSPLAQAGLSEKQFVAKTLDIPEIKRDILMSRAQSSAPQAVKTNLKLEGITSAGSKSTAIINADVYKVGSQVGGYTLKQILSDHVVVTDGERDIDVPLASSGPDKSNNSDAS